MGIVVSSRQASNIFWHSVTCLNAICVLISSLQRPQPQERRGVRWFFPFPFCCFVLPLSVAHSVLPSLNTAYSFSLLFSHVLSSALLCFIFLESPREFSLPQDGLCLSLSCPCLLDKDRSTDRQKGHLPVHPYVSVPAPRDPGVQHASQLSYKEGKK